MTCEWFACPEDVTTKLTWRNAETGDVIAVDQLCDPHAAMANFGELKTSGKAEHDPGRVAYCKGCGAPIRWQRTAAGKPTPIDENGQPHWATCPQAAMFKQANSG